MKRPRSLFFLMFCIYFLLNLNYTILRCLRTTLAVVDLGGGSHSIPIFELFAAMPSAFLMTWGLTRLMNRFSIEKVFIIVMANFIGFFVLFNLLIYPYLLALNDVEVSGKLMKSFFTMLFYVVSELWKPSLALILFWGLVNQYTSINEAKRIYAPLLLSGSLGAMIAGPMITLCTSEKIFKIQLSGSNHWEQTFNLMIILIALFGLITTSLYYLLWKVLTQNDEKKTKINGRVTDKKFFMMDSIEMIIKSDQLRLLSWIVIADYIAYTLGEVIFLDILKLYFSEPSDYCHYMGHLSLCSGALTFISSIALTPFIIKNYRWLIVSMITPILLLITEGTFFIFLRGYSLRGNLFGMTESDWLKLAIALGSIQYCLCRAAKYTLFDSSKELAFVLMPEAQRIRGKIIIDGLCARFGRAIASLLSISLIHVYGGVILSSFASGFVSIGVVLSWLVSTFKLGKIIDNSTEKPNLLEI